MTQETNINFNNLQLAEPILKAIESEGYTTPTPIQAQSIPVALSGKDLIATAQTGTGKTAAFMMPALQRLTTPSAIKGRGPRVLVLTPTRELAQQVNKAAATYGKFLRCKTVSITGGAPYPLQIRNLGGFVDVLVATPGRLIDHMESGRVDFSRLELLILDEADRMLDMGFIEPVELIARATPKNRQTLMFSATMDEPVKRLAERILKNPVHIALTSQTMRHEQIEQRLHVVDDLRHKNEVLNHVLTQREVNQAIVFTATKRDADRLASDLHDQGHSVAALHGDMNQGARNRTLTRLRHGDIRILVATDVAARGIDVPAITHVVNYDLPMQPEDYVHRIGRTGRAGAKGIAVSLASQRDLHLLVRIERHTKGKIPPSEIAGLEPRTKLMFHKAGERGRPSGNGGRGKKPAFGAKTGFGTKTGFGAKPAAGGKPSFGGRPAFGGPKPAGEQRKSWGSDKRRGDR